MDLRSYLLLNDHPLAVVSSSNHEGVDQAQSAEEDGIRMAMIIRSRPLLYHMCE